MTVPSSFVVMVPSPSLSNKEKASLNSEMYNGGFCQRSLFNLVALNLVLFSPPMIAIRFFNYKTMTIARRGSRADPDLGYKTGLLK
jgi:hypothetical protein